MLEYSSGSCTISCYWLDDINKHPPAYSRCSIFVFDIIHGQAVRRKDQEKECHWISLDFALQPHLYEPGWTLPPTPSISDHLSKKFNVPRRDRIYHLVVLSKTLQHAFGQTRTEDEFHAYLLLHKYYDLDSNSSSSRGVQRV